MKFSELIKNNTYYALQKQTGINRRTLQTQYERDGFSKNTIAKLVLTYEDIDIRELLFHVPNELAQKRKESTNDAI